MAELERIEEEFPTAELAGNGNPPKQPEGPKLVKGQESETSGRGAEVSERMPLFSESETGDFRSQWSKVQTGFVDEPRRTVEEADKLVAAVMQRLAEGFADERLGLEKQWDSGDNASTEATLKRTPAKLRKRSDRSKRCSRSKLGSGSVPSMFIFFGQLPPFSAQYCRDPAVRQIRA